MAALGRMVACSHHPHFPIGNLFPGYAKRWNPEKDDTDPIGCRSGCPAASCPETNLTSVSVIKTDFDGYMRQFGSNHQRADLDGYLIYVEIYEWTIGNNP